MLSVSPDPAATKTPAASAPLGLDAAPGGDGEAEALPSFEEIYDQCFELAWRNLRRLGVPDAQLDDAVQDVFLIVHRRLGDLHGRASMRAWICSIVTRVASDHRRAIRRKSAQADHSVDADMLPDPRGRDPYDDALRGEGVQRLHRTLDALDDDKRVVFVLAELEQMSAPEIAESLGENVNTVYARLRAARHAFETLVAREQARDDWRLR